MSDKRRYRPLISEVFMLFKCRWLAGWHLQLLSVRMRPRWKEEKCQTIAPYLDSFWFDLRFSDKSEEQIVSFNHLEYPCLCWTTTQPPLCVARRHCGQFHRGALSQAHSRMWRNPQCGRRETRSRQQQLCLRLGFTRFSLSLRAPLLLSLTFSSPTTMPRRAC